MRAAIAELEQTGRLIRITDEVDPNLEIAAIHRRVNEHQGPALYFEKVKNSPFPAVSNLFGTSERVDFLFRREIPLIQQLAHIRNDPKILLSRLTKLPILGGFALNSLAKKISNPPVMKHTTTLEQLPLIKSWPADGGAFVTMPQVISQHPDKPGIKDSNIGMYRIQLDGNDYLPGQEVGLHYQIHRGIGVHHQRAKELNQPFKISVCIGGPPAHSMAAILPLPEGMSETIFAGLLNGRRYRYTEFNGYLIDAEADFVITGIVDPHQLKREGPFGDHLGYYSLEHLFPVMKLDTIYHRPDPVWHFTVVGRPPAEDSGFGYMIHKLFGDTVKEEFPGLVAVHAVDAAGVHPLLLAIGMERYMPFRAPRPEEILTIANRLLGSGQTSLAKYLFILADSDGHYPDIYDLKAYFKFILERIDFTRDLHFITNTTIDTLDYSGTALNAGSKLILAVNGPILRELDSTLPENISAAGITAAKFYMPGVLIIEAMPFNDEVTSRKLAENLAQFFKNTPGIGLVVLADDAIFTSANDNNFVWVTFTRSDPARDTYGSDAEYSDKHWSIRGPLLIDARKKPHHAPELVPDAAAEARADRFFTHNRPLAAWA